AGGNLAAVVSLLARDAGGPPIALQVLIYPVTDVGAETPSYQAFADGYLLTREGMHWFAAQYLASPGEAADWRASPLRALSLTGVAPALVVTAGFDPLRDEGEAYARRLRQAGVRVDHIDYGGMIHGFVPLGRGIDTAPRAVTLIPGSLRQALRQPLRRLTAQAGIGSSSSACLRRWASPSLRVYSPSPLLHPPSLTPHRLREPGRLRHEFLPLAQPARRLGRQLLLPRHGHREIEEELQEHEDDEERGGAPGPDEQADAADEPQVDDQHSPQRRVGALANPGERARADRDGIEREADRVRREHAQQAAAHARTRWPQPQHPLPANHT